MINKQPLLIIFLCLASLIFALKLGSIHLSWLSFWQNLTVKHDTLTHNVIWQLRLPRVLTAFCVGGLLALSGNLLQILLQNPLAEPYILGISGGAACAYLTGILLGVGSLWLPLLSFIGALIASGLVLALCLRANWQGQRLLLTGIIIAAGFGALNTLLLSLNSERQLHSILFWLMGDLQQLSIPYWPLVCLSLASLGCWALAPSLNVLSSGSLRAQSLGVNCRRLQLVIYVLSSLLTAIAVSLAGTIGFVGLIIPQLLRLIISNEQRYLIPLSVLVGGSFLAIADALARSLLPQQELPIGCVTALIGVPVFLYLLRRAAC